MFDPSGEPPTSNFGAAQAAENQQSVVQRLCSRFTEQHARWVAIVESHSDDELNVPPVAEQVLTLKAAWDGDLVELERANPQTFEDALEKFRVGFAYSAWAGAGDDLAARLTARAKKDLEPFLSAAAFSRTQPESGHSAVGGRRILSFGEASRARSQP